MTRTILRLLPWMFLPLGLALVMWGARADADDRPDPAKDSAAGGRAARYTADWPERPRQVAGQMMQKYGMPDQTTASQLVWHDKGPWKRVIVHRQEVRHDFPMAHVDVLEQVIDYQVPPDKFDQLAQFNGSLMARRTQGELSAMCDKEAANILALNLAEEIIEGMRDVKSARLELAATMSAALRGESPPMTQKLMLDRSREGTADRDVEVKPATRTPGIGRSVME